MAHLPIEVLTDHVEVDGAYFGGTIRPENRKADRIDRRLACHPASRRLVVAFQDRQGRTLPFVTRTEAEGVGLAVANVDPRAILSADEATHWNELEAGWPVMRINPSLVYSEHGRCTNQVESFFSRLRRMVAGQHHHVSPQHLHQYANQAAWLEDNLRRSNGALAFGLVTASLDAPVSRAWKGYWQRTVKSA